MKRIISILLLIFVLMSFIIPFITKDAGVDDSFARRHINEKEIFLEDNILCGADEAYYSDLKKEAIETCDIINEYREDNGLKPLEWDNNLESVANIRAVESSELFSHTRPDGSQWYTVNSKIQGGENLAYGFDDGQSAVKAWQDSPTHNDNMLYYEFSKTAIGIYKSDGVYYWAQEFGY